jgi:hypothetical protein
MKRVIAMSIMALSSLSLAQEAKVPQIPQGLLGQINTDPKPQVLSRQAAPLDAAAAPKVIHELVVTQDKPVTVDPDQFIVLDAESELSGADRVTISATSLGDSSFRNLRILPAWASVKGEYYTVTDISQTWPVPDHGGFSTPTAGSRLRLLLYNGGTVPIKIVQLVVHTVIHP